jgi:DNA primase
MCPYHENNVTPSFSLSKTTGQFLCFNHSCGAKGNLIKLVKDVRKMNDFQAMRFIAKYKAGSAEIIDIIKSRIDDVEEFPEFRQEIIDRMHQDLMSNGTALQFVHKRGLNEDAIEHFELGYSEQTDAIGNRVRLLAIPMHDERGNPVGVVGRSIDEKKFKNSRRLPTSKTLWNIHRAKKSSRVIIVESAIDAMLLWQLGHNAVAILSGILQNRHMDQIMRYFDDVIIMSDDDDPKYYPKCRRCDGNCRGHNPGRDLGRSIERELLDRGGGIRVRWAVGHNPGDKFYDRGVKDVGDMFAPEIDFTIRNAQSPAEMRLRGLL